MNETIDQSILEDQMRESQEQRQFNRHQRRMSEARLLVGLSLSLALLVSGIVLITFGPFGPQVYGYPATIQGGVLLVLGFLFLPLGLWALASVIMGGLGEDALNRLYWGYMYIRGRNPESGIPNASRTLFLGKWIGSEESIEQDAREQNEKAENVEAMHESDKTREEREKSEFD